jgi:hypothetical protein
MAICHQRTRTVDKRGYNCQEALAYLGIKRRAFEKHFRPYLTAIRLGTAVVFDRFDLDHVLQEHKTRNGRPVEKGGNEWADQKAVSIATSKATGVLIRSIPALDFAGVSARILKKRKTG